MRFFFALLMVTLSANRALTQQPVPRPYDGIQAGLDAFRLGEERRQAAVAQQFFLNEQRRFWPGYYAGRIEAVEAVYAYGYPQPDWFAPPTVFEPWPVVPGDIYGYPLSQPIRQPIGQRQQQTGPRRWESHPVYAEPIPEYQPLPSVASPWLDPTPYATPRPRPRER